jgi:hypothetical protein
MAREGALRRLAGKRNPRMNGERRKEKVIADGDERFYREVLGAQLASGHGKPKRPKEVNHDPVHTRSYRQRQI